MRDDLDLFLPYAFVGCVAAESVVNEHYVVAAFILFVGSFTQWAVRK